MSRMKGFRRTKQNYDRCIVIGNQNSGDLGISFDWPDLDRMGAARGQHDQISIESVTRQERSCRCQFCIADSNNRPLDRMIGARERVQQALKVIREMGGNVDRFFRVADRVNTGGMSERKVEPAVVDVESDFESGPKKQGIEFIAKILVREKGQVIRVVRPLPHRTNCLQMRRQGGLAANDDVGDVGIVSDN